MSAPSARQRWFARARVAGWGFLAACPVFLSFPPVDLGPLVLVAFVPWFLLLHDATVKRAALLSTAAGWFFFFGGLFWVNNVTTAGFLLILFPLAGFATIAGTLLAILRRSWRLPLALAGPLAFVAADVFRSFVLSGFPWLYPGHALVRVPVLIQIADCTGAFGVSALALAVNGALADAALSWRGLETRRRAALSGAAVALLFLAAVAYGVWRMDPGEETGPELLIVQGNIPQSVKDSGDPDLHVKIWDTHVRLTLEGVRPTTDLVVWPETMVPRALTLEAEYLNGLLDLSADLGRPILAGAVRVDPAGDRGLRPYNSAVLVRPDGTLGGVSDKAHLVPGGEYIPLRGVFPALEPLLTSMFGYVPDVEPGRHFPLVTFRDRAGASWPMGILVCYEVIFAELARPEVRGGARFIVNVTNEGWFGSWGEQEQIHAAACLRAVENRVTVVRAANTGISAFVGPDGREYAVLERAGRRLDVEGTLAARVRLDDGKTVFGAVGNLFGWVLWSAALALAALGLWRNRKRG